jgi:hypothetical protein
MAKKKKEPVLICAGCEQPRSDAEAPCEACGIVDVVQDTYVSPTAMAKAIAEAEAEAKAEKDAEG